LPRGLGRGVLKHIGISVLQAGQLGGTTFWHTETELKRSGLPLAGGSFGLKPRPLRTVIHSTEGQWHLKPAGLSIRLES